MFIARHSFRLLAFVCVCAAGVSVAEAQKPGTLDPSFGTGGVVRLNGRHTDDRPRAVFVQADNKTVIAAVHDGRLSFLRYNVDGSLDETFGDRGIALKSEFEPNGSHVPFVETADGGLLFIAQATIDNAAVPGRGALLVKLTPGGVIDRSFGPADVQFVGGHTGMIDLDAVAPSPGFQFGAMCQDGDHLIVAAAKDKSIVVVRVGADGVLDAGFGAGGLSVIAMDQPYATGECRALDDGRIMLISENDADGTNIMRLASDGTVDPSYQPAGGVDRSPGATMPSFGDPPSTVGVQRDGSIVAPYGSAFGLQRLRGDGSYDLAFRNTAFVPGEFGAIALVAVQPDDRIVILGFPLNPAITTLLMARYNADGTLDTGFGGTGVVWTKLPGQDAEHVAFGAFGANGQIVETVAAGGDVQFTRYDAAGVLDAALGSAGLVTSNVGDTSDWVSAVAVAHDGSILAAGVAGEQMGVLRLDTSDGSPSGLKNGRAFYGDTFDLSSGPDAFAFGVADQPDGKVLAAGLTYDAQTGAALPLAIRWNPDGTIDSAFPRDSLPSYGRSLGGGIATAIAPSPAGGVYVGGAFGPSSDHGFIWRLKPDGSLDTFAFNDLAVGRVLALHVMDDGRVLVGGVSGLLMFQPSGIVDTGFGTGGFLALPNASAIGVDSLGRLLVASGADVHMLTAAGVPVPSFGRTGVVTVPIADVTMLAARPSGKVIVGGIGSLGTVAVTVLYVDGSVDTSFGDNGTAAVVPTFSIGSPVAVLPGGNVLTGGFVGTALVDSDYVVARLFGPSDPIVSIDQVPSSVEEAAESITLRARLSGPSLQQITVAYATRSITATAGQDYQPTNGTLTFAPGETVKTITIPIVFDDEAEPTETFALDLSAPSNAILGDTPTSTISILDTPVIKVTTADAHGGPGECSLIDAIVAANTDSPQNGCPAGHGADVISIGARDILIADPYESYRFGYSALPVIQTPITIRGQGGDKTTLRGDGATHAFTMFVVDHGSLELRDMTIRDVSSTHSGAVVTSLDPPVAFTRMTFAHNHSDGTGGVYSDFNGGPLTVTDSTFIQNTAYRAGALEVQGSVHITHSTFVGNMVADRGAAVRTSSSGGGGGGGAHIEDTLFEGNAGFGAASLEFGPSIVERSTFRGNDGAGLYSGFRLTLSETTIADNGGTGLYIGAGNGPFAVTRTTISGNAGGGVYLDNSGSIANTTISGNTTTGVGGGIYVNGGNVSLNNVTAANNASDNFAAGIFIRNGSITLTNSIVAGNKPAYGAADLYRQESGVVASGGFNLIGVGDDGNVPAGVLQATDNAGTSAHPLDPKLAPLGANGGPTLTQALLSGSPAIDGGNNLAMPDQLAACEAVDQRNLPRPDPAVGRCDIGAFEGVAAVSGPNLIVIKQASGVAFAGQPLTYTITVENSGDAPAASVLVTDPLPAGLSITSASATQGACTVAPGLVSCGIGTLGAGASATVTIHAVAGSPGLTTNAATVSANGAHGSMPSLSATASTFVKRPIVVNSTAEDRDAGACTLTAAIIAANTDQAVDGCTAGFGDDLIILPAGDYTFDHLGETEWHAALPGIRSPITIRGDGAATTIIERTGGPSFSLFFVKGSALTLSGVTIQGGNNASGGGIFATGSDVTLADDVLANNHASTGSGGGAYWADGGRLTIRNSTFDHNTADYAGGAIDAGAYMRISASTFTNNTAGRSGGAIAGGALLVDDSRFDGNGAGSNGGGDGGAVNCDCIRIARSTFTNNGATQGGAIAANPRLNLSDSTIDSNHALKGAGVNITGSFQISGTTISNNAGWAGNWDGFGAGVASEGNGSIVNSTISGNQDAWIGAGLGIANGNVTLNQVTLANNTSGNVGDQIDVRGAQLMIANSIVGHRAGSSWDLRQESNGSITSGGHNLVAVPDNLPVHPWIGGSDIVLDTGDPRIGPLADNGGPTRTHALLADSPALDAGSTEPLGSSSTACATVDQRGHKRPVGQQCDIGAVEMDHAPTASDLQVTTAQDTPVDVPLAAADVDSDPLTFEIVEAPLHGTAVLAGGVATYTPDATYAGADAFKFSATDGVSFSNVANVSVTITSRNHPPVAADDMLSIDEGGTAQVLAVLANDHDDDVGDTLTITAVTNPTHGTVAIGAAGLDIQYTPPSSYNGADDFTYTISDGHGGTAVGAVHVTVNVPPPVMIDIAERVHVADVVVPLPAAMLNIAEMVHVTDAVTPLPAVMLDVAESIHVVDAVTSLPAVLVDLSESIHVTDSITQTVTNTPAGPNITVTPTDPVTGTTPVAVTFTAVTTPGDTVVVAIGSAPPPPPGTKLGNPPTQFDVTTTASYTAPVTICTTFAPASFLNPASVQLLHYTSGGWVNLHGTIQGNTICGQTNSLSPFAVVEPSNRPPTADAGPDRTVEATSPAGALVVLNGAGSTDPDGDPLTYAWTGVFGSRTGLAPSVTLPLGLNTVTLTVNDGHGGMSTDTVAIRVVDTTAPSITGVSVDHPSLWPPNHKLVDVVVSYGTVDLVDRSPVCMLTVTSNEPINGTGDGDTAPDWVVIDAHHLQLRAERAGTGKGRVYSIVVRCADVSGNAATKNISVTVPK